MKEEKKKKERTAEKSSWVLMKKKKNCSKQFMGPVMNNQKKINKQTEWSAAQTRERREKKENVCGEESR